jgi:polyA polymerase family protein
LTKRKEPLIYLEKLIKIRVELNGEDLKELGIQDGKKIGAMLDEILKKKLAGTLKNKADEINFVKSQRK